MASRAVREADFMSAFQLPDDRRQTMDDMPPSIVHRLSFIVHIELR
jgi:hypothetical protein